MIEVCHSMFLNNRSTYSTDIDWNVCMFGFGFAFEKFTLQVCCKIVLRSFFTLHNTFFDMSLWLCLQMSRTTCHLFSVSAKAHRYWSCLEVNFHYEHPCVLCVSKGVKLESNFESDFGLELRKKSRGHGIESVRRDFSVNFGARKKKSSVKGPVKFGFRKT